MKAWFLYCVQCSDGTIYTGVSTDVKRRVREHNRGPRGAKYTRSRRPVHLVYQEEFKTQSAAMKAEAAFKKLSRAEKLRRRTLDHEGRRYRNCLLTEPTDSPEYGKIVDVVPEGYRLTTQALDEPGVHIRYYVED